MAYNNGREDRKWRIWKEAEEKVLREHGVDETTIEQIRIDDRADFNSNRRFYHWTSDFGEYLEGMADKEQSSEIKTVTDLLDEIEDENLYQALLTVDRRTLQIVLLKMQGYSTKEIAPLVHLTTGAIYARLDHVSPFKFTADMATAWRKVKSENDLSFTIQDMLKVYYGKSDYAKYDNSVCQWNQFLKDFCADENSCNYSNKLKVAAILWKEVRNSRNEKIYSKNLLTEYAYKIKEYCK